LFKPQIISTNRIKRDKSIWDELYTPKQKPILLESPSIKLINKNSEKITEKLRNKKYQQIFNDLKPIDGKIKYSTIDFKSLDEKLVEILSPLLKKLAESSCETDFSHFWEEMDSLLKVLTPDEKKYLILLKPKC
jgi:CRISPR/Cas system CSM-associated protein Csm2 small subunit